MENTQKLKFRLIEATSEDPNNPLFELIRGSESSGWMSSRFCTYPQEIIIQFLSPVNLKQINILSNEKKISSMIEFYSYYPSGNSDYFTNYKLVSYEKLGYIRMDSNSKSKYRAREFRKVFINTNCIYLKLVMNKNYVNKYNVFNQVGLIGLEFMGTPINYKHNELYLKESLKEYDLKEYELDDISQEKLKIMKTQQEEAIKIEDYDEAKRLKKLIDRIKFIGRKIHELEVQKKIFINNEDYDNAKIIKLEIDRLKSNLKNVDKNIAINAQNISVENNKSSEGDEIITENYHKDISVLNDTIQQEKESKEKNDKENTSFSINMDINPVDKSIFNRSKSILKIEEEDEFQSHDDTIIPAILKKLNQNSLNIIEEIKEEQPDKGELDELSSNIKQSYEALIKVLTEEPFQKIFSKNILWKEEGCDDILKNISKIFSGAKNEINTATNQALRLINSLLSSKHPQLCIRSMEIFQTILTDIKKTKQSINYDFTTSDNILIKIKEKLGDNNSKISSKAVELYLHMLNQDFCDYNNLMTELVDDDLRQMDFKKINRSPKSTLGKLSILGDALDSFDKAVSEKKTDMNSFPFVSIATFVIENISHSKSEVRKLDRSIVAKMNKIFGFKKLEPLLKKVNERELEKLVADIPEIQNILKNMKESKILLNNSARLNKNDREGAKKGGSTSRGKNNKKHKKSNSQTAQNATCTYCGKSEKNLNLEEHVEKDCVMFINCVKCSKTIEIKYYTNHMLSECSNKIEFKVCKRCKEAIDVKEYDLHLKDNKCNPAKNPNSNNRCPLCHKDIAPHDKGLQQHLVKDICQKHKRREKISFVNGK